MMPETRLKATAPELPVAADAVFELRALNDRLLLCARGRRPLFAGKVIPHIECATNAHKCTEDAEAFTSSTFTLICTDCVHEA